MRKSKGMIRCVQWCSPLVVGLVLLVLSTSAESKGHNDKVLQGLDCSACHNTDSWGMSDSAGQKGGFDHDKTGFPLTGEHGKKLCTSCHAPKRKVSRDCFTCHKDQHRGRVGRQCEACHNSNTWQDTGAIKKHRMTRLPLTGMHAVLDCSSCHVQRANRQYQPVPSDCFACHEKDYRGNIHPIHTGDAATGQAPFSRVCSQCHQTASWTPAYIRSASSVQNSSMASTISTHDKVFVLSYGAHRDATCRSCHSLGKTRTTRCEGCHVHSRTRLRQQHKMRVPSSARACLGCHPRGGRR